MCDLARHNEPVKSRMRFQCKRFPCMVLVIRTVRPDLDCACGLDCVVREVRVSSVEEVDLR